MIKALFPILIFLFQFTLCHTVRANGVFRIQSGIMKHKPWDPFASGDVTIAFNNAVFGRALYVDKNYEIIPGYISSWRWDYKTNRFILTLDKRRKYHDGRSISAYDFEFVLTKPFLTTLSMNDKEPLGSIKGVEKLKPGMPFKSGMVEGIRIIDNTTLSIALEHSNPSFLYSLGDMLPPLAPIDSFKEDHYHFKDLPVGSGAYRIKYSDPSTSYIELEKVDKTLLHAPDTIQWFNHGNAYLNDVDIAFGSGVSGIKKKNIQHKKLTRIRGVLPYGVDVIDFNFQTEAGRNIEFRKMITLATNRQGINKAYLSQGKVISQLIPSGFPGRITEINQYDLEQARNIFKKLPPSITNKTHIVLYHGLKEGQLPRYIKLFKDCLNKISLKTKFIATDKVKLDESDKSVTLYMTGRVVSYIDPLIIFSYYLPNGFNRYHTMNDDQALESYYQNALRTLSGEERAKYLRLLSIRSRELFIQIPHFERYPIFYSSARVDMSHFDEFAFGLDLTKVRLK